MLDKIIYFENGLVSSFSEVLRQARLNTENWKNQDYNPDTFLKAISKGSPRKIVDQLNNCSFIKHNSKWEFNRSSYIEEAYSYTGRSKDNQVFEIIAVYRNE